MRHAFWGGPPLPLRLHRSCLVAALLLAPSVPLFSQGMASGDMHSGPQEWPPVPAPEGMLDPGPGWPPRVVDVTRPLPGKGFREGFVDVDGFHVRYVEKGTGQTIIDVPGSAGLEFSSAKDILARDHHVIELNPPGDGPDSAYMGPRDEGQIAEVFVKVLAQLKVDKFDLISTSVGCFIGMRIGQLIPDRVLSITFEGGECFTRDVDHRGQAPRAIAAQQASANGKGPWEVDYSVWQTWPAYQWQPNKWWQTPSYQGRLMRRRYTKPWPSNKQQAEIVAGAKDMKMPVIAMVGDRDEIMKISVAQAWKKNMPQAKVAVVAGGTHDIQNSQPEAFVEIMEACSLDRSPSKLMCPGD
jgi:pimeloyl-ACP methyl ester carboxylesterase